MLRRSKSKQDARSVHKESDTDASDADYHSSVAAADSAEHFLHHVSLSVYIHLTLTTLKILYINHEDQRGFFQFEIIINVL